MQSALDGPTPLWGPGIRNGRRRLKNPPSHAVRPCAGRGGLVVVGGTDAEWSCVVYVRAEPHSLRGAFRWVVGYYFIRLPFVSRVGESIRHSHIVPPC